MTTIETIEQTIRTIDLPAAGQTIIVDGIEYTVCERCGGSGEDPDGGECCECDGRRAY